MFAMENHQQPVYTLYTDGAGYRDEENIDAGGWAYVLVTPDKKVHRAYGGEVNTDVYSMERHALFRGLETLLNVSPDGPVACLWVTDCQGLAQWVTSNKVRDKKTDVHYATLQHYLTFIQLSPNWVSRDVKDANFSWCDTSASTLRLVHLNYAQAT